MESTKRSLALDVFRGLTIAGMILVNNPGSWRTSYAPLRHAEWHGCTPTDLVFPFFLFIMGVAVPLALGKRLERGDPQGAVIRKILSRTFLIFFIGLFLHAFPQFDFANLRIPGVLQRIALVYGITSIIYLKTTTRQQVWIGAACLLVYWGLMTLVPVPGVGYPNLEPTTNLGAWLDNLLLPGHLYSQTKVWDPEGLLSTMPAVTTGLIGVLTGTWLRTRQDDYRLLTGIFAAGCLLAFGGLVWDLAFPINKKIWTSSYVLYVGGLALLSLGVVYWLVEVRGSRWWVKPFVVFGTNALFAYVLSGLLVDLYSVIKFAGPDGETINAQQWVYRNLFQSWLGDNNASLAYAVFFVLICLGITWILYARKIFIKV